MNCIQLLSQPHGVYIKTPKKNLGGCAIWDLAAVTLMLTECSGSAKTFGGKPLLLNRSESNYFGDVGLILAGASVSFEALLHEMNNLQ